RHHHILQKQQHLAAQADFPQIQSTLACIYWPMQVFFFTKRTHDCLYIAKFMKLSAKTSKTIDKKSL
ncbi:MAG: hypothetical protein IK089_06610, partial [Oxalobacter sp.]|nr:hypothetical protein [Oxalobacter sp.]